MKTPFYLNDSERPLYTTLQPGILDLYKPGGSSYPFHLAHEYLERCIAGARVLLAIGYSFRDPAWLDILRRSSRLPRIVVAGPRPSIIAERIRKVAPSANVATETASFGEPAANDAITAAIAVALEGR